MDAKPFRLTRPLGSGADNKNNNNANLPNTQTLHQRHKSTGNLSTMSSTGNFNLMAKRTALADRNAKPLGDTENARKAVLQNTDKPAIQMNPVASAAVAFNSQENRVTANPQGVANKPAFLQPAQRPKTVNNSISMVQLRTHAKSLPNASRGQKPTVYKDFEIEKDVRVKSARHPISAFLPPEDVEYLESKAMIAPTSSTKTEISSDNADHLELNLGQKELSVDSAVCIEPTSQLLKECNLEDNHSNPTADEAEPSASLVASPLPMTLVELPSFSPGTANDEINDALYVDAVEQVGKDEGEQSVVYPSELINPAAVPLPPAHGPSSFTNPSPGCEAKPSDPQPPSSPQNRLDDSEYCDDDGDCDEQGYTTAHSYRSRGDNTTGGMTTVMLPPKLTKKGQAEIEAAKSIVDTKKTSTEIQEDAWDVSMVAEYGDEIFEYMRTMEMALLPNAHYMDIQTEIQWSMRSVLLDWVIQVHTRFGLYPETLFLAINCIDRFLSVKVVSLGKLQLVGATAIFIAAKYEEINCPSVNEIVYMVDQGYSFDEVLKAERFMLSMLEFEMGWPGPMSFLRRISKADDYDLETRTLAKYFLEVAAMDERFVASPASYIAAGAHCLSRMVLRKGDWTPSHVHYSGYTFTQLKPLVTIIFDCCRDPRKHHAAVFDKYADKRFRAASLFVYDELQRGFNLSFQPRASLPVPTEFMNDQLLRASFAGGNDMKMPIPTQC
ncbi:hypothetical protein F5Y16DRAFT_46913 [Xylariaceae sp. FL0255]|nr:hypothetical protein F5Y16DRAFT_46913 [Xylariaceae sp. FL0255]